MSGIWEQGVNQFVDGLAQAPVTVSCGRLFNPWHDTDCHDCSPDAHNVRRDQLRDFLIARHEARYVLVAEAIGYQGGRCSGIAMTSERMLHGHHAHVCPRHVLPGRCQGQRTSNCNRYTSKNARTKRFGFTEPTATIVWRTLCKCAGLDPFEFVLWNLVPWHPHKPGDRLSNRTPTDAEQQAGLYHAKRLVALFNEPKVITVGNKAMEQLYGLGTEVCHARHPANGGAKAFRCDILRCLDL